ncbi:uncharacterized protein LOC141903440 isoform X2 [Tubulanus polymorphus]
MPFFNCETYEVYSPTLRMFGHFYSVMNVIEFRVEISDDLMLLTYERCCMLQCQKVFTCDSKEETPFSFLQAKDEGYFSDLVITADTGKQFNVHKTILMLSLPKVDWCKTPTPLTGLPENVLHTVIHYLYAECLPKSLTEETAKCCVKSLSKLSGFTKLTDLCEIFLKNTAVKLQITSLMNEMHSCVDRIIDMFNGKVGDHHHHHHHHHQGEEESLMANPAKLCYILKQAIREMTVAGAKFLILCDLFTRKKAQLSRDERNDIIRYSKSRIPVFMNQLLKLISVCKQHARSLSASQRYELATYLVPEIENTLEMVSKFILETKTALEQVISSTSSSQREKHETKPDSKLKKPRVGDVLGKTLKHALHMKELMRLKNFHEKTSEIVINLMMKKESFTTMSEGEKIRLISRNLEQLGEEVLLFFSIRVEELMAALDEKFSWREWKYFFKLGTSKVAWLLSKLVSNKENLPVQTMLHELIMLVHRDQLTLSLVTLGLVEPTEPTQYNSQPTQPIIHTTNHALNAVESLCIPPRPRDSRLAQSSLNLLRDALYTDMLFEVVTITDDGDTIIDHNVDGATPVTRTDRERDINVRRIPAHCVIIAARCDWFRRALLSGMRESIDKKIVVHDTNPVLFQMFLEYLYSGQLDMNELTTEQMVDMLQLGDRYEVDSLKFICEQSLKHRLDEENVLFLLSLADQYNAKTLRAASLTFISDHPETLQSEIFTDLPEHLQTEAETAIGWPGLVSGSAHGETTHSSVSSLSEAGISDVLDQRQFTSSSSSDEAGFMEDSTRLETCISALRDIVGDDVPRDELVNIALAADYDTNRALNFFFSS